MSSVLAVSSLLLTLPLLYRGGFGEPDVNGMATGAYQTFLSGKPTGLYFHQGQVLYNLLLISLVKHFELSADGLITLMNLLGAMSMAVSVGLLCWLCRQIAGWLPSLLAALTYFFSPIVWELGTYGHPQTMSIALMLGAFVTAIKASEIMDVGKTAFWLPAALSVSLAVLGLLVRMDGILLQPLLIGLCLAARMSRIRSVALNLVFPFIYAVVALLVRRLLLGFQKPGDNGGLFNDLLSSLAMFSTGTVTSGMQVFLMAAGTGTVLILIGCCGFAIFRRDYRGLLAAAILFGPVFYYSALNPFITRRFIHSLVLVGFTIAVALRSLTGGVLSNRIPAAPKGKLPRQPGKRRIAMSKTGIISPANRAGGYYGQAKFLVAVFLITIAIGNFVAWPFFASLAAEIGKPFPERFPWNRLSMSLLQRHFKIQEHIRWTRTNYVSLISNLPPRSEMIGGWVEQGNILMAFSRMQIPVAISAISPEGEGRPAGTLLSTPRNSIRFFGPPWDLPPPQRFPVVFLLDRYPADVPYGRRNVREFVPPEGIQYLSW